MLKSRTKSKPKQKKLPKNMNIILLAVGVIIFAGIFLYNTYYSTNSSKGGVDLYVINDADCGVCDPTGVIVSLERYAISDLNPIILEPTDEKAQKMISELNITTLPAFVFDKSIENAENFTFLERYMDEGKDYYLLRTRGSMLLNREEIPNKVDLFVMSHCPFGTLAEDNLVSVLDVLKGLNYEIHFIASEYNGTIYSLHGPSEVQEDKMQSCIMKYYPSKTLDYLTCYNANYTNTNQSSICIQQLGLDQSKLDECVATEGKELLLNKMTLSNALNIASSPTLLINNKYLAVGLKSAEEMKQLICAQNPELEGCDKTIENSKPTPSGVC